MSDDMKNPDPITNAEVIRQLSALGHVNLSPEWLAWRERAKDVIADMSPTEITHCLAVLSCWNEGD